MKESELKNIIIKKVGDLEGYTKEVERYFFSKINFISLEREIHNCNKAIFNFPYEVIIDNYPDDEVTIEEDYTSKYIELYLEYAYQIMIRIPLQTYISILESVQLYQDDQFLNNKKRKQRILNFENGLRHGDWVYYHNEIISVKGSYRNGKKVGKLQEYSSNGKILKEINYEYNDVRRYLEKKWFASGAVSSTRRCLALTCSTQTCSWTTSRSHGRWTARTKSVCTGGRPGSTARCAAKSAFMHARVKLIRT